MNPIIFISSDPGVTNALIPVARNLQAQGCKVQIVASGPAIALWEKDAGSFNLKKVDDLIGGAEISNILKTVTPSVVVTGAGAYNMIEHNFRLCAERLKIPNFAIVDYWAHYPERFRRKINGALEYSMSDKIGVMDDLCRKEMIAEGFPPEKLVIVGAPHLEEAVNTILSTNKKEIEDLKEMIGLDKGAKIFVYFSQTVIAPESNIREDQLSMYERPPLGFTQRTTLKEILAALSDVSEELTVKSQLIIKHHPSETVSLKDVVKDVKTSDLITSHIVEDFSVAKLISIADVALGLTSTALLEASLAGKLSLSVQIDRNLKEFPDIFYGNRTGLTVPIFKRQELKKWLKKVINSGSINYNQKKIDFAGSIKKTSKAIIELANKRNTGKALCLN